MSTCILYKHLAIITDTCVVLFQALFLHKYLFITHPQAGDVPLGKAAEKGHLQIMKKLLNAGANVNHQNKVMTIHSSYVMLNTDSACMMSIMGALSHK